MATNPGLLLLGAQAVLLLPLLRRSVQLSKAYIGVVCPPPAAPTCAPYSRPVITTACLAQQRPNRILGSALSGLRLWKILQWLWPHYLPTPSGGLTHTLQGPTNTSYTWLSWGPGWVLPQPDLTARSLWTPSTTHTREPGMGLVQRDVREAGPLPDPDR